MLRNPKALKAVGVKGAASRGKPTKTQKPVATRSAHEAARTDPYFRAAFQLSGDWR